MSTRPLLALCLTSVLVAACSKKQAEQVQPDVQPTATAVATSEPTAVRTETAAVVTEPPKAPVPVPAVRWAEGIATPESVLYDEAGDRYLVSNINGKAINTDNKGYIAVLSPDGKVVTPKWIEGGQKKVTLNAPKGMALVKGVLYVADLDTLRMFDAKTGASKGDIKLEGATFANDVAAGPDGKVYVSDSGLKMEGDDFRPTGTDAVFVIERGKAKKITKAVDPVKEPAADWGRPNGLLITKDKIWVNTFGTGELYSVDKDGNKQDAAKLPQGSLDGMVAVGDTVLVSSWSGSSIFQGKPGGEWKPILEQLKAPADIGYDSKRKRVLVPRFLDNAVEAYDVK